MERMPVVAFHIPQKMLEELESMAREKNITVSELVRIAVADLIKSMSGKVVPNPRMEKETKILNAVKDVTGKINREGIIDKHELYSYLRETHGLSYHEITNKFLISLKEELQRKNLILIENEVGDFVVINIMKLVRGEARTRVMASAHSH